MEKEQRLAGCDCCTGIHLRRSATGSRNDPVRSPGNLKRVVRAPPISDYYLGRHFAP